MMKNRLDSFKSRSTLSSGGRNYDIFRLETLAKSFDINALPFSMRVFAENVLRNEDGHFVNKDDVAAVANWAKNKGATRREASFMPARVLMQDFTGVPAVVDLAAMRDAVKKMNGDPTRINPLVPVDLVVDHSIQVDQYGSEGALAFNSKIEFDRNKERYSFLNWGQKAFKNFSVVPPETGIVHQVNLEYLARCVWTAEENGKQLAYPDTLVGTDSHTTMINGLGVVGWGVGGIEAEAVMLGQPVAMLIPQVVGFKLTGKLPEGATATDAVLRVVEILRQKGVVGKFVEFYGAGLDALTLADRATIANMGPEYGATVGFFPVDQRTLEYLAMSNRSEETVRLVEDYCKAQGLFRTASTPDASYTDIVEMDLGTITPAISGPKRPQDRIELSNAHTAWDKTLAEALPKVGASKDATQKVDYKDQTFEMTHGRIVIAAITSCTNTSNPGVMMGAGLLAKKAAAKGLQVAPWVKTSLAPGSQVVTEYLKDAGLLSELEKLGFFIVGYGCTTCIGNSGPLPEPVAKAVDGNKLVVASVLSGNRNFEGRISSHVRANYLASPPLVVAYAIAGRMDIDLTTEPLGVGSDGKPVMLKDIWPSNDEIQQTIAASVRREMFAKKYEEVADGPESWRAIKVEASELYPWDGDSTYVQNPPYFDGFDGKPSAAEDIQGARALLLLGDSVTTDHISPAGAIAKDSPAGDYLRKNNVAQEDFNSYGSRRGNHEVMMRGTFANIRIRNQMLNDVEGGYTLHLPEEKQMSVFDAAMQYRAENVPTIVIAGKEYGTGSSRDWAAKGPALLGLKAAIAESYERIHRSNLIGMGVLPLQFREGESAKSHGLTGLETFNITGLAAGLKPDMSVKITATDKSGAEKSFEVLVRLDTPAEVEYCRYGGILRYVLAQLNEQKEPAAA
jgi:aconitate hydratase